MWYGISVNGLAISFGNFIPEAPWDVMNVDTGGNPCVRHLQKSICLCQARGNVLASGGASPRSAGAGPLI